MQNRIQAMPNPDPLTGAADHAMLFGHSCPDETNMQRTAFIRTAYTASIADVKGGSTHEF
jgi:hypothetical protein